MRTFTSVLLATAVSAAAAAMDHGDEFGPGMGNSSNTTNTTNTTVTTTTTTTVTTTIDFSQRIQLGFFFHNAEGRPTVKCLKDHSCNSNCALSNPDQGAYFFTLDNTDTQGSGQCGCKLMPTLSPPSGVQTHYKNKFYYQFAMKRDAEGGPQVTSLAAVCHDDQCKDCEIDHRSIAAHDDPTKCDPTRGPDDDKLEPYHCYPVNPKVVQDGNQTITTERGGSWFVHPPVSQELNIDHEVCVLEQHSARSATTNTNAPVTLITYPSKSSGHAADGNGMRTGQCLFDDEDALVRQATKAFTNTPLAYNDCSHNGDGTMYKLDVNGTENPVYEGFVNCRDGKCDMAECDYFTGPADVCPPVSDTVAVVRADGQLFGADGTHVPVCSGFTPNPTLPASTAPSPTADPNLHPKKDGDGTVLVAAVTVGVLFFGLICYGMFVFLRRRKLKRMNAYAALQDDPTF